MAIRTNFGGFSLRKPGAYSRTTVDLTGGFPVADTGIVGIIGEADLGAPGSVEDIRENYFSPDQFSEVVAKYKSGPIVDAFRLLIAPSNDDRIPNGAQRIYIYKTNLSTKASAVLPTAYGSVYSRNYGFDQNTISFLVSDSQDEAAPAIPAFSFIPDENTSGALGFRVNGELKQSVTLTAPVTPTAFQLAVNALTDIACSGGVDRGIIDAGIVAGGETAAITFDVSGLVAEIDIAGGGGVWAAAPTVGDTLYIPAGSVIEGATAKNVGGYIVKAATTTKITVIKMADPLVSGEDVAPVDIAAITDAIAYSPISISYNGTTPDGQGASIEMFDDGGSLAFEEFMYGGSDRGLLTSTQVADGSQLKLEIVSGANVKITVDSAFAAMSEVGDILVIRPDSILKGASNENVGNYRITNATSNEILATKFSGTPVAVSYTDIAAVYDIVAFEGICSSSAIAILNYSSSERQIQIALDRQSDSESEDSSSLGGNIVLKIGYDGTTATCTINSVNLSTLVVGGSGSNLTIKLSDYDTIRQLVDYIDAQTGYSAEVGNNVLAQLPPSVLDRVSAIAICAENPDVMPGRIKSDSYEVQDFFDSSVLCSLTRTLFVGLPDEMSSATFLTSGAKGGTAQASVTAGIDEMQKVRVNSIIPLFSRNATDDILDGLTEPSSSYTIASINAAAKNHAILMSNTQKRSERNAYCSYKGTFTDSKSEANSLASSRSSLALQDVKVLNVEGQLEWKSPWALAAIAAGMQAGALVGEPMTFKYINVYGIRHADFDPATQYDDAIDNGILFAEQPARGGFRIVLGNTTYSASDNFAYNRISVMYSADTVAYNSRQQLESIYVGVNSAFADAQSIKNTVIAIMQTFLAAGIIKGDDTNGQKGYKNLTVRIEGNVARVGITITPAQGVDFVLADIVLDTIRESA